MYNIPTWIENFFGLLAAVITFGGAVFFIRRKVKQNKLNKLIKSEKQKQAADDEQKKNFQNIFRELKEVKSLIADHKHPELEQRIEQIEKAELSCSLITQKTLGAIAQRFNDTHETFLELKKIIPTVNAIQVEMAEVKTTMKALAGQLVKELAEESVTPIVEIKPKITKRKKP